MRGPHGQHRKGRFGEGRQNKQATLSDTHPFRFVTSKVLVANVIQIQIQIQFQGGMQIQIRISREFLNILAGFCCQFSTLKPIGLILILIRFVLIVSIIYLQ